MNTNKEECIKIVLDNLISLVTLSKETECINKYRDDAVKLILALQQQELEINHRKLFDYREPLTSVSTGGVYTTSITEHGNDYDLDKYHYGSNKDKDEHAEI